MTPPQLPAGLVPVSGLVHRVLGAATRSVSDGSRRNARAAIEARQELTRHGAEVLARTAAPVGRGTRVRRRSTA